MSILKDQNFLLDLKVPLMPEFLKVIRLYVSGASSIIGFNLDEIEDIKVAVSEVCNILTSRYKGENININCRLNEEKVEIIISFVNGKPEGFILFDNDEDEMALAVLNALVDETTVLEDNKNIISISVTVKET